MFWMIPIGCFSEVQPPAQIGWFSRAQSSQTDPLCPGATLVLSGKTPFSLAGMVDYGIFHGNCMGNPWKIQFSMLFFLISGLDS